MPQDLLGLCYCDSQSVKMSLCRALLPTPVVDQDDLHSQSFWLVSLHAHERAHSCTRVSVRVCVSTMFPTLFL